LPEQFKYIWKQRSEKAAARTAKRGTLTIQVSTVFSFLWEVHNRKAAVVAKPRSTPDVKKSMKNK
jgi:hypothetical protein